MTHQPPGTGLIDLRSDTVTRPTPGMRRAMADAEVGDDVYGEDPTVRALEQYGAELLGHEAAVFVPSGTMGNFCALRASAPLGTEVVADTEAHIVTYELGGLAALGGVQTRTLTGLADSLDLAELAARLRAYPDGHTYNKVRTSVLAVENTRAGGRVWPLDRLERIRAITDGAGIVLHCDGARIWNAAVALGVPPRRLGELCGTLSVCRSKGLGAPVGSLVVGDAEHVERARVWRKRLGGGMRQAGVIAAGGLYALRHHLDRLADDHRRAADLAERLADAAPGRVLPQHTETNMVLVDVPDAVSFARWAKDAGVLVGAAGPMTVRLVTHLGVDDAAVRRAGDVLAPLLAATPPAADPLTHPAASWPL